jgi:phosphatidylserine decarboxylase
MSSAKTPPQGGGCAYRNYSVMDVWLPRMIAEVQHSKGDPSSFHPVIQEFQRLIEGDPALFMHFHLMFEQTPTKAPYNTEPDDKPRVGPTRNAALLLSLTAECKLGSRLHDTACFPEQDYC